ncbi:type II toxin-antitoxin system VapB family antitoxin [Silvibacterium dinghuense]|nr:type II toxin-antitoxin system VapB family antitoxin [Silvibacterium dinghuense]
MSIKNEQTESLARQLSEVTGESITATIRIALEERLARVAPQRTGNPAHERAVRLGEIIRRVSRLPILDTRPEEDILGYGEHGLPE